MKIQQMPMIKKQKKLIKKIKNYKKELMIEQNYIIIKKMKFMKKLQKLIIQVLKYKDKKIYLMKEIF